MEELSEGSPRHHLLGSLVDHGYRAGSRCAFRVGLFHFQAGIDSHSTSMDLFTPGPAGDADRSHRPQDLSYHRDIRTFQPNAGL